MDIKAFLKFGREDFTKETYLYFGMAVLFIIVALSALAFYLYYIAKGIAEPLPQAPKTAEQIQLEELTNLAKDIPVYSEEEIQSQIDELNILMKKSSHVEKDEEKQIEELNSLLK